MQLSGDIQGPFSLYIEKNKLHYSIRKIEDLQCHKRLYSPRDWRGNYRRPLQWYRKHYHHKTRDPSRFEHCTCRSDDHGRNEHHWSDRVFHSVWCCPCEVAWQRKTAGWILLGIERGYNDDCFLWNVVSFKELCSRAWLMECNNTNQITPWYAFYFMLDKLVCSKFPFLDSSQGRRKHYLDNRGLRTWAARGSIQGNATQENMFCSVTVLTWPVK